MTDIERRHLLEVLDDRCGSRSTIMTSQYPTGSWHDLIGSPTPADAIVERMLTNSHKIDLAGETMRPLGDAAAGQKTRAPRSGSKEDNA